MLTGLIEAVSDKLQTIYHIPVYQIDLSGEDEAYFFLNVKEISDDPAFNKSVHRKVKLEILYHAQAKENIREVWKVADSILRDLEEILLTDGNIIRGGDLQCEFTDNILHTFAIRKGEFNTEVPVGARFSFNELNYIVTEQIQPGVYKLQCETGGAVGNRESGQLIPIDYIEGLKTAALTEVLIPGQDEEETEIFRERYLNSFDSQAFGGNVTDYKEKVGYISGVGSVKVYPIWNGGGTVKLVILDSDFNVPSEVLIDRVQTIVDPTQNNGEGVGIAPIGHVVTVIGAQVKQINVSTNFTYQDGYSFADIKQRAEQILEDYYKELSRQWAESGNLIVRISQIETRLLSLEGVVDIAETRINESPKNIQLEPDEIPIRGSLNDVQSLA